MNLLILPISVTWAALAAILICVRADRLGQLLGLMDVPDERKQHRTATPLVGGIVLLICFVPPALFLAMTITSQRWFSSLVIWLACVAAMTCVGLADDRHSLSPRARLFLSFTIFASAAAIDPTFNVRILDFEHPAWTLGLGSWWLAIIFTVTCLVGLINAVNMADGKNGLVLGLALGWLALLVFRAPAELLPATLVLSASLLVLFAFNLKGRLFLGDGGAYGIACAVGLLAIMIYNTPGDHVLRAISADELMLLFAVPVFDSFRLTYKRARNGRSPMSPDRDHLHHHLQNRLGWPKGLAVYFVIALLPPGLLLLFG